MRSVITAVDQIHFEQKVTNLLIRYWGFGIRLSDAEKELLLSSLDEENKALNAPIHRRAIARLREMGIE